jgi:hypothetical protein
MKGIEIDKLILNISAGESGDRLTFATRVLEQLSGQKPCHGKARYTVRQFGIRRNENISSYVTVRGQKAKDIIERGLKCKEYELNASNFSATGNFGFGIRCVFIGTPFPARNARAFLVGAAFSSFLAFDGLRGLSLFPCLPSRRLMQPNQLTPPPPTHTLALCGAASTLTLA